MKTEQVSIFKSRLTSARSTGVIVIHEKDKSHIAVLTADGTFALPADALVRGFQPGMDAALSPGAPVRVTIRIEPLDGERDARVRSNDIER